MSTTVNHRRGATLLVVTLLVVAWLSALGFTAWRLRQDALANAGVNASMHARNFAEHLTQTLQVIDLTAASLDPVGERLDPQELSRRLGVALRPAAFLRSISLIDASGRVVASSNADNVGVTLSFSGFYPPAPAESTQLRIGMPWAGRDLANGQSTAPAQTLAPDAAFFIPVMRRIIGGEQALWVVATINPEYFINHFVQLLPAGQGHAQILRYDDRLLVSSSLDEGPGASGRAGRVPAELREQDFGLLAQTADDGRQVLIAYRGSSQFPVFVTVHLDRQNILAGWRADIRRLSAIILPILLALTVAGVLLWRRQRRYARQQAELSNQRRLAASVFEASTNAVILTSPDGDIISVNPAFETINGYRAAEALGRSPRLLSSGMHPPGFYRELWETLIATGHWQGEIINRRKDGELYTGLLTISAVRDEDGQLMHYVCVTTDITERKRYESELLAAKERAEAAVLAKTTFLATMSHELRTPMNGVLGMTELLLRSELNDKQRRQLGIVKGSAEALLTLLNEILDYSKIEAQGVTVEITPYDPTVLIGDIVGLFVPHAEAKGLSLVEEISADLPHQLLGDAIHLRQILTNLLNNAIKFTRSGGITVRAWVEPAGAGRPQFCLAVSDTGIGIPADKQEIIFTAFTQADGSHSRSYGGTGLGLAICRRLAQAMQGSLQVVSTPGSGSCFTLKLPLCAGESPVDGITDGSPALPGDGERGPAAGRGQRRRILLVEDNPGNQLVTTSMLESEGYDVTLAGDGAAALAQLRHQRFDAILMDVQMPNMDGLTATRAIRNQERESGEHVLIVALTANAFAEDRDICLAAGMDDFLAKPVSFADLERVLAPLARAVED